MSSRKARHRLFSNNFYHNSFFSTPVELCIENLLPGSEIQPALGYRHHHLVVHQDALQVGVPVILACAVVAVVRPVWRQALEHLIEQNAVAPPNGFIEKPIKLPALIELVEKSLN